MEIIDNSPIEHLEGAIDAPIIAVRPLTSTYWALGGFNFAEIRLTEDFIIDAARQHREVNEFLARENIDPINVSLADLRSILEKSGYTDIHLLGSSVTRSEAVYQLKSPKFVTSVVEGRGSSKILWDATTLTNMVATGIIDIDHESCDDPVGICTVGFTSADTVTDVYRNVNLIEKRPIAEQSIYLAALQDEVKQYDSLARSILVNVGDITFGRPIYYNHMEKDLVVPQSISREFDVYWVELAATFREMDIDDIAEMAINFATPEGSVALELFPLRYSKEYAIAEQYNSPELSVEAKGVTITLGEFFKRTVAYRYLRPTVVASGLGERRFSWTLYDDAVRSGSHRFVAILAVPKGEDQFEIAMSGHVRLKKTFLGGILGDEVVGGTEPKVMPINLSR